jgi:PncC family amidohydrolase
MTDNLLTGELASRFRERNWTLAVAESCTGGLICDTITNLPGSSDYFLGGIIAYSDRVKMNLLAVPEPVLKKWGAVSGETALALARSVRIKLSSDVGAAVTGIAGPSGGSPQKPVGLVYVSVVTPERETARKFNFKGTRSNIKRQASDEALKLILSLL